VWSVSRSLTWPGWRRRRASATSASVTRATPGTRPLRPAVVAVAAVVSGVTIQRFGLLDHEVSLIHGWLPWTVQVIAAAALAAAVGWRSRWWRLVCVPSAGLVGVVAAGVVGWYINSTGMGDAAPLSLSIWIGFTVVAVVILAGGWRGTRWWRRVVCVLALPLCLLCAALAVNQSVGYLPTVQAAWGQATGAPVPDQADEATVASMQRAGVVPAHGAVEPVTSGDQASHFAHRTELVYLPPTWFATNPPPKLPTVMMIGGMFSTPADWIRAGDAITTLDNFAAAHGGNAPVVVFVDAGGSFNTHTFTTDTECVNGTAGNTADHLTKDVVPFMISKFGVSTNPVNWGVVGWSMGGTCAIDLTVMHPDMFSAFIDIQGDLGPNVGTKAQTIARLYGRNADVWAAFDPTTVMIKHGRYSGVSGVFSSNPGEQAAAANSLCGVGSANGIECTVDVRPGKHDWPFAANAFATYLPWLAGQLGTPGSPTPQPPTIAHRSNRASPAASSS